MVTTRPSSRITIGEAYYDLIDDYDSITQKMTALIAAGHQNVDAQLEFTRHDNHKKITVRLGSIDTVQQMGF